VTRRVLWLIKGLGAGGAEHLLVSAAEVRDRSAFAYEAAYLLPWKDTLAGRLTELGVPVWCLATRHEADPRWAWRLRRLLHEREYDIVHAHSPYVAGVARLVTSSLPRRRRPRLVSTTHNAWDTFALPTRLLNAVTAPLDDALLAVSPQVTASMWPRSRGRAETLLHGVALDRVRAAAASRSAERARLGIAPRELVVGTVANYTAQKDYPTLLAAARIVTAADRAVRFCAVGQGPLEDEIIRMRDELGLAGRVIVTGYQEDATRVMAGFDVFVLASRFEGLPVALMEALALGLPVVATSVGGVPSAVTDGLEGLLVPPGSPEALAGAIARLTRDPALRHEMAEAARRRGDDFDIARAVRRVEAVYRQVVGP
jgi:glycosyltransferase involved in cell wall biosynthesis